MEHNKFHVKLPDNVLQVDTDLWTSNSDFGTEPFWISKKLEDVLCYHQCPRYDSKCIWMWGFSIEY